MTRPLLYRLRPSILGILFILATSTLIRADSSAVTAGSLWEPETSWSPVLYLVLESEMQPGIKKSDPLWQKRLEAGWTLQTVQVDPTTTPETGAAELAALSREIEEEHGPFRYQLVQARGELAPMALEMVENPVFAETVHGALVFNADFDPKATSQRPLRPLFFISHRDQLTDPLTYLAAASKSFAEDSIAVHSVDRKASEGFLPAELNRSLIFTYNWVSGELPARLGNATYDPPAPVGSGQLTNISVPLEVVSLEVDFGNLEFDDSYPTLAPLELSAGDLVAIRFGEEVRFARYTDRFNGVPEGDWALVKIPSGELRASVFMGNASEDIGAVPGDMVEIVQVREDE